MIILVVLVLSTYLAEASQGAHVLRVNQHVKGALITLDTEVKSYVLQGLQPSTGYEVRVSFPASLPAKIQLELSDRRHQDSFTQHHVSRKLLDCDKIIFWTDKLGQVKGSASPVVLLTAKRGSVHRNGPLAGPTKLVYNIVLVDLLLGIPTDTFPVIGVVVVLLLGVVVWTSYWTKHLFPWLLVWILGSTECTKRDT
eukprot:jgi/Chrzof1/1867/Cz10g24080.t1